MEKGSEKYRKVTDILKTSRPVLDTTTDIENEVIKRISKVGQPGLNLSDLIDFLFGWVYVGWVRNSLVTASVLLVILFIWQQSVILKRIDLISRQTIIESSGNLTGQSDAIERGIMLYKISGHRFPSQNITISEKEMEELLESLNDLQIKYKDLLNIINEDPELKQMIEKKINANNRTKTKM